jgi:hypothetical protein
LFMYQQCFNQVPEKFQSTTTCAVLKVIESSTSSA